MAHNAGNLCMRTMSDEQHGFQKKPRGVLIARGDFIAAAAVVSVFCGALLPVPAWFVDIAWGCSLCLSTALVLISLMGKEPLELSAFPPLMVFGALLRMGLSAATTALVFRGRIGGTLIEAAGESAAAVGSVILLPLLLLATAAVSMLVFRSAGQMTAAALKCLIETIPDNESELIVDEQAGLISPYRARELKDRSLGQTGFYLNIGGAARLMRCDAVIGAGAILTIIVGQLLVLTMHETMSTSSLRQCSAAAVGGGVLMLLPPLAITAAAAGLTKRTCRYLKPPAQEGRKHRGEVIEIVSQETGRPEQVELLNPDFTEIASDANPSCCLQENISEFLPRDAYGIKNELGLNGADSYYDALASHVANVGTDGMPVLFAALSAESLPVTVAVNVGIRLAQRGLRTLVIDAESGRQAVAAVFEADNRSVPMEPVATCVENLFVWGLNATASAGESTVDEAIRRIQDFDHVIVYAPNLPHQVHAKAIIAAAAGALIFADAPQEYSGLEQLLRKAGCCAVEQRPSIPTAANGLT